MFFTLFFPLILVLQTITWCFKFVSERKKKIAECIDWFAEFLPAKNNACVKIKGACGFSILVYKVGDKMIN